MAMYPCDRGPHRYLSRQQTAYVGLLSGVNSSRYKLRLCPDHFGALQDDLAEFEVDTMDPTSSVDGSHAKCVSGLEPLYKGGWEVFVTVYPTNEERKDYWGKLCSDHPIPPSLAEADGPTLFKENAPSR